MAGAITYAAVALLARERLDHIITTLRAKKQLGTARELELHVLRLAELAHGAMSSAQPTIPPPMRAYGPPLTDGVSRFTLLGAMGPDLMRYASLFAPGQDWLYQTLHKGTPDENRERVYAESTNLVFEFWKKVGPLVDAEFSSTDDRFAAKRKMQAYVLGHVCHIATDVLVHPWFDSIEAELAQPGLPRLGREEVAGSLDRVVANNFFGRSTATRGSQWSDWFPSSGDMPDAFYEAMSAAIIARYGARPQGLPAFETAFAAISPPPPVVDKAMVEDAVTTFRSVIDFGRTWTLAQWLGATAAMFLPIIFAYPLALVLPRASNLTKEFTAADGEDAEATRSYELATFPFAMTALGPLVTMIIVSASGRGLRAEGVTGWVNAGLQLACAVGFFATLGGDGVGRWIAFFALPLSFSLFQMIFAAARSTAGNIRTLLWLGPAVGFGMALLFMLCWATFLHEGIEEFEKDSDKRDNGKAWGYFFIWLGIAGVLWVVHAILWRWVFSRELPEDPYRFNGGEPRRYLRLYDDATLIRAPGAAADATRLGDFIYPPTRRPILKIWWEGPAAPPLSLRIDHDRLVFSFDGAGAGPKQTIFVPLVTTTVDDFGKLLAAAVKDSGGATGKLKSKPFLDTEKALELSPGFVLSDHGDSKSLQSAHDTDAANFVVLGTTEASALILHHAPRQRLATVMARTGPAREVKRADTASVVGSTLTSRAAPNDRTLDASVGTAGGSPLLRRLFQPGDIVVTTAAPIQQRVVEAVPSETELVVSSPFSPALAAAGYKRLVSDWTADVSPPAGNQLFTPTQRVGIGPNDVQGTAGTVFGAILRAGDLVRILTLPRNQTRRVVAVKDGALTGAPGVATPLLELESPLAPPVATGSPVGFQRVAEEQAEGFAIVADPDDAFGAGGAVMNDAADLATLLCLAGASRLDPPGTPLGATSAVHKVYEVFRNWDLDRRRVNEWKALVGGGAFSEKRGNLRAADDAAPIDAGDEYTTASDAFIAKRQQGETLANELGWLSVFRGWLEMAGRPVNDSTKDDVFRPGQPTNLALTRAMAFLLDAREPAMP
jgi:hypothetical protein